MNNDSISSVVSTLYKIKEEFPYLSIGQIFSDFHTWCFNCGIDVFYLDDEEYYNNFREYFFMLKFRTVK